MSLISRSATLPPPRSVDSGLRGGLEFPVGNSKPPYIVTIYGLHRVEYQHIVEYLLVDLCRGGHAPDVVSHVQCHGRPVEVFDVVVDTVGDAEIAHALPGEQKLECRQPGPPSNVTELFPSPPRAVSERLRRHGPGENDGGKPVVEPGRGTAAVPRPQAERPDSGLMRQSVFITLRHITVRDSAWGGFTAWCADGDSGDCSVTIDWPSTAPGRCPQIRQQRGSIG